MGNSPSNYEDFEAILKSAESPADVYAASERLENQIIAKEFLEEFDESESEAAETNTTFERHSEITTEIQRMTYRDFRMLLGLLTIVASPTRKKNFKQQLEMFLAKGRHSVHLEEVLRLIEQEHEQNMRTAPRKRKKMRAYEVAETWQQIDKIRSAFRFGINMLNPSIKEMHPYALSAEQEHRIDAYSPEEITATVYVQRHDDRSTVIHDSIHEYQLFEGDSVIGCKYKQPKPPPPAPGGLSLLDVAGGEDFEPPSDFANGAVQNLEDDINQSESFDEDDKHEIEVDKPRYPSVTDMPFVGTEAGAVMILRKNGKLFFFDRGLKGGVYIYNDDLSIRYLPDLVREDGVYQFGTARFDKFYFKNYLQ